MRQYMLDTNICIYIIKRKPANVVQRIRQCPIAQVTVSSITLSELEYGVAKSSRPEQNQIALAQFLAPMEIVPYGGEAAQHYGRLRAFLEKQGTLIGALDMLIAAHALSLGCLLVTKNEKEFRRVPDLKIDNWTQ
jgi:tRNA(fMet)-specific endonuclease VapC